MNLSDLLFGTEVRRATASFRSEGHPIIIDSFVPQGQGPFPAVIALHGSGGIRSQWAADPASLLAGRGFAVFVPHYFERTGTAWADDRNIRQNFLAWMKTITDAISYAARQPEVNAGSIGLLGFSLGGYLALSVASQEPRVKAVVEYFGGLPEELAEFRRMPPTLILHGDADLIVPVSEAHKLQQWLERAHSPYEIKIYSGQGHGFSAPLMLDAGLRTLKFLQQHLQGDPSRRTG